MRKSSQEVFSYEECSACTQFLKLRSLGAFDYIRFLFPLVNGDDIRIAFLGSVCFFFFRLHCTMQRLATTFPLCFFPTIPEHVCVMNTFHNAMKIDNTSVLHFVEFYGF